MEDIHIQRVKLFIFSQIFDRQIPALESSALVRRRFLGSQETSKWSSTILLVRGRENYFRIARDTSATNSCGASGGVLARQKGRETSWMHLASRRSSIPERLSPSSSSCSRP